MVVGSRNQGFLEKVMSSIAGVLFGIILLIVSIGLLFWNEGRVDPAGISKSAIQIDTSKEIPREALGKLVSANGQITTSDQIGDTYVKPSNFLAIKRNVEMYAWQESRTSQRSSSETGFVDEVDGGTEPEYYYSQEWTSTPEDSANFAYSSEHYNPPKVIDSETIKVGNAKIGELNLNIETIDLPPFEDFKLTEENIILADGRPLENTDEDFFYDNLRDVPTELINSEYLFKGIGTFENPEVGDVRISYSVVPTKESATVFGVLGENSIEAFVGPKDTKIYRLFYVAHDEAVLQMSSEHSTSTWGLRIFGFILMWIALSLLLAPVSAIADLVPLVGQLSRGVIGIVTFIIAAVLSTIVILVSMLLQNLVALLFVVVLALAIIYFIFHAKPSAKK